MIGLALHLVTRGLDTVRAEMAEARSMLGWGLAFVALGRGTPDPSEVEQLGAECDALRDERDTARAQLADVQRDARWAERRADGRQAVIDRVTLELDEARLEHAAAVEVCEELKELLATARTERDQARAQAEDREARALKNFNAYCRERHQFDALAEVARALVVARRRLDTASAEERSLAALALLGAWKPLLDLFPEADAAEADAAEAPVDEAARD